MHIIQIFQMTKLHEKIVIFAAIFFCVGIMEEQNCQKKPN